MAARVMEKLHSARVSDGKSKDFFWDNAIVAAAKTPYKATTRTLSPLRPSAANGLISKRIRRETSKVRPRRSSLDVGIWDSPQGLRPCLCACALDGRTPSNSIAEAGCERNLLAKNVGDYNTSLEGMANGYLASRAEYEEGCNIERTVKNVSRHNKL